MIPSVEHLYPNNSFIYQQDNCPVHTANIVRNWFENNNVETLPWIANSPDINPIENVWGKITKILYRVATKIGVTFLHITKRCRRCFYKKI
jgi:transposase